VWIDFEKNKIKMIQQKGNRKAVGGIVWVVEEYGH
jgi:hypothetical protein